jgi:3-hydroxyacyl-[acyl-carrier-protein] dehydratase
MPRPTLLVDPADYPLDKVLLDQEGCKGLIPQRFEFLQVTSVLASLAEENIIVVHRHLDDDEFWVRGHIPGRPIFPGVLMVESMAQVAALQSRLQYDSDLDKFIGFGGVDRIRFRSMVVPGDDILIVGHMKKHDNNRGFLRWEGQILKTDGTLVADGEIVGMAF